jgi:hypothetical protein
MRFCEHCQESIRLFGKSFEELHQWIDEFAGSDEFGMRHRSIRHHLVGIEEAVEKLGEEVREAARRHIISDLEEEGWREGVDPFPKNSEEYKRMGLF